MYSAHGKEIGVGGWVDGQHCTSDRTGGNGPARAAWVSWFFNAAMSASPMPVGALSGDRPGNNRSIFFNDPDGHRLQLIFNR
jgi:hypothetical protein